VWGVTFPAIHRISSFYILLLVSTCPSHQELCMFGANATIEVFGSKFSHVVYSGCQTRNNLASSAKEKIGDRTSLIIIPWFVFQKWPINVE
jgi:hypothetical protein